jgi:putative cell wall-binding protein
MVAAALLLALLPLGAPAGAQAPGGSIVEITGGGLVPTIRWAGVNRWNTAELVATDSTSFAAAFDTTTVVLARGDIFPDALAGSYLAGGFGAAMLLTAPNDLPAESVRALEALAPERLILLGGSTAITDNVINEIRSVDSAIFIERVGGNERYETATEIARLGAFNQGVATLPGASDPGDVRRTAFLATGERPSDALVAGAAAYAGGYPLLLTASNSLPQVTRDTLIGLDIERVIVVGGTAAVSASVATAVAGANAITVERVEGPTRVDTAVAFAQFTEARLGFAGDHYNLATSANEAFADSLAVGAHAGFEGSAVLLTSGPTLGTPVENYLKTKNAVVALHVAGGTNAVPDSVLTTARTATSDTAGSLSVSPETTTVLAGETATVLVSATNRYGGFVPESVTVNFDDSGGDPPDPAPPGSVSTGPDGYYSHSFTLAGAGRVQIQATFGATTESQTATVDFVAVPADWEAESTTALTAAAEVPGPGDTGATGTGRLRVDTDSGLICVDFTGVTGIQLPASGAHIHEGISTAAVDIVVPLTAPGEDSSFNNYQKY